MAVQIPPRIQAENPVSAAPAPRLEAHPLNTEAPMQMQQDALEGIGKEVIKYHDQVVNQEADNVATEADNNFQDWHKKRLYGDPSKGTVGILYQQGDPKVLYDDFNKEAQKKLDELSSAPKDQDWSGITQNVVNRRLNKRAEELHNESLTSYGHQKYEYDKGLVTTNVDFAQKAMPLASAFVDPDHPETFGPLQGKIEDIRQPIIQHALQYGGAVKSEDGSLILTPAVKAQISKAVSDGLYKTIDNLYNADEGDGVSIKKADAVKHQFADQLDPFHKDALGDKAQKSILKQKSLELSNIIIQKGPNAPEVQNAPLEIRQNAVKMANEYTRDMDQMKQRKQNDNYDVASKALDKIQQSGQPYSGVLMMRNDPTIKRVWDNLSAKQQQALEHSVEAPKTTSPAAQAKWLDLISGQHKDQDGNTKSLVGMPRSELMTFTAGMKASDQKSSIAMWTKMNTQSGPQMEQQTKAFAKEFQDQSIGAGLLHKVPNSNILTASDQPKYEQYKKELLENLDHYGATTPPERSKIVAQFIADKKAGTVFTMPTRATLNGSSKAKTPPGDAAPPTQTPPGTPATPPLKGAASYFGKMNETQKMEWIINYKKANKGAVPNEKQMNDFVDKQTNGKGI